MKIVQKLDPNKAHGQHNISICMIKICGKSICKLLRKIFEEFLKTGTFPLEWKRGNVVQMLKEELNKFIKIIGLFRFCQLLEKILRDLFLKKCFRFLSRTN